MDRCDQGNPRQGKTEFNCVIREAQPMDLECINRIYNEAISMGIATAHTQKLSLKYHIDWFNDHQAEQNPIWVAECAGKVVGWNVLSFYRKGRQGLEGVRETSYYVDKDHRGRGVAKMLMEKMLEVAKEMNISTLVAFIMDVNDVSIRIMDHFGFEKWGCLPGILKMPQGTYDHLIFGKNI